ncbi:Os01g0120600, partial [Oryza sativa Japonica Group]
KEKKNFSKEEESVYNSVSSYLPGARRDPATATSPPRRARRPPPPHAPPVGAAPPPPPPPAPPLYRRRPRGGAADLLASHVAAGQFLPFRLPAAPYPIFLAISSSPPAPGLATSFDFLVKRLPGTPSACLCDLRPGDLVHVGGSVVGRGFEVGRIADARDVLVFATGSGISPIRSLIESGFGENENIDVKLFYGVRNLQRMAYQERFTNWESSGIKIIPVLSRPDDQWTGERGYVQNAFSRMKKVVNPSSMGAILCGHKQMSEEITRALVADGVPKDRILTNF